MPVGVSQITTPENFAVDPNEETGGWSRGLDIKNKGVKYGCFGGYGEGNANSLYYMYLGLNYNDANAFRWHQNGKLSVGDDVFLNENGNVMEHGARVYSPNNKPSAVDTGAVPGQLVYYGKEKKELSMGNYIVFNMFQLIDNEGSILKTGNWASFSIISMNNGYYRLLGNSDGAVLNFQRHNFSVASAENYRNISVYKLN